MKETSLDVAVVGAGTAGLFAMARVLDRTESALIFEGGQEGTMCARAGCMPSKALLHQARSARDIHGPGAAGTPACWGAADYARVMDTIREKRDGLVAKNIVRTRKRFGDRIIREHAAFVEPMVLAAGGARYRCRAVVLATGSLPVVPPGWRQVPGKIVTTEEFFDLPTLPREILVVGMGPVGIELSQAMALLGPSVTAVDSGDTAGGVRDPEILATLKQALEETPNLSYHFRTGVELMDVGERVGVKLTDLVGGARWEAGFDLVLLAVGRAPTLARLDLGKSGLSLDERGRPRVDERTLSCEGQPAVFMAGDASGIRPFFHDAADQGRLAGANAVETALGGQVGEAGGKVPLNIVFTEPNVAAVGLDFSNVSDELHVIGETGARDSGRGFLDDRTLGRIRLYVEKTTGNLSGAALCAPEGEHLAHFLALAIHQGVSVDRLMEIPYYHPTYEELLPSALLDAKKKLKTSG